MVDCAEESEQHMPICYWLKATNTVSVLRLLSRRIETGPNFLILFFKYYYLTYGRNPLRILALSVNSLHMCSLSDALFFSCRQW